MRDLPTSPIHPVAVVGSRGYSGQELCRILLRHPQAKLVASFGTGAGTFMGVPLYHADKAVEMSQDFRTVFLATPAEVSTELAPKLLAKNVNVIDISGAYRLTQAEYPLHYGFEHPSASLLLNAHYGLLPWTKPMAQKFAQLISNPGCYATAALLALIPLIKNQLIDEKTLVIDAKSGTTGAGKKADEALIFSEVDGECLPYKIGKHQHLPEIIRYVEKFADKKIDPIFTTSLLSVRRGIIAGVYARLNTGITEAKVAESFAKAYDAYPLIKHGPAQNKELLLLKKVVGSAHTHISYAVSGDKLFVFATIDNLLKGAASQAIENFNCLNDWPVDLGLEHLEGIA